MIKYYFKKPAIERFSFTVMRAIILISALVVLALSATPAKAATVPFSLKVVTPSVSATFKYTIAGPTSSTETLTTEFGERYIGMYLEEGTYEITQEPLDGWEFDGVPFCSDQYGKKIGTPAQNGVTSVVLSPGMAQITCNFKNKLIPSPGKLIIVVETKGGDGDESFNFFVHKDNNETTGGNFTVSSIEGTNINTIGGIGQSDPITLSSGGPYTITQTLPDGWGIDPRVQPYCSFSNPDWNNIFNKTGFEPIAGTVNNVWIASNNVWISLNNTWIYPGATICYFTNIKIRSCFICEYQAFQECPNAKNKEDCGNIEPDEGGKGDCEWRWMNNKEGCYSRFVGNCDAKMASVKPNYDWTAIIPKDLVNVPWPNSCTTRDYYYTGHSTEYQCTPFFNQVNLCVNGLLDAFPQGFPPGSGVSFKNDGCSTFANKDVVDEYIKVIKDNIPSGFTVTVSGNQAVSSLSCKTAMEVKITKEAINVKYGPCHVGSENNFCYMVNDKAKCTDSNNQVKDEICCDTGQSTVYMANGGVYTLAWFWGTSCPAPAPAPSPTFSNPNPAPKPNLNLDSNQLGVPILAVFLILILIPLLFGL